MRIGVVGGGAWGTALATAAVRAGNDVLLWAREEEVVADIERRHANPLFLPGIDLDPAIRATGDLAALAGREALLLVTPAQHLRATATALAPHFPAPVPLVICAKGIELESGKLMSDILAELVPGAPLAALSGPSFATEVARGLPAAATLACADAALGERLGAALSTPLFRLYRTDDLAGAQLGGAVKNVYAIACGVIEGRALGDNARAALITRALVELGHLVEARGGRRETVMGLAGLGDLILTCTSGQSRNYALGRSLGEGARIDDLLVGRRSVAEGVHTSAAVIALAEKNGIDMPIAVAVDSVVNRAVAIDEAVATLLARPVGAEAASPAADFRE
ncbi:MAG: NAD(P)H-dependent glycerol-3-phosphate dehydrogenase [Alphaproteobacteria bacterium]